MKATPVLIRMVAGNVVAVFPTLPASDSSRIIVFSLQDRIHEMGVNVVKNERPHNDIVEQFLTILKNLGITPLRYYNKQRDWMIRDKRISEENGGI